MLSRHLTLSAITGFSAFDHKTAPIRGKQRFKNGLWIRRYKNGGSAIGVCGFPWSVGPLPSVGAGTEYRLMVAQIDMVEPNGLVPTHNLNLNDTF